MRVRRFIICVIAALLCTSVRGQEVVCAADSIQCDTAMVADTIKSRGWVRQLFDNGFHINDPGINYPRFARFLLKVYNWGDKAFNSYDPEYVVGTGKNWKAYLRSDNWLDGYLLQFPHNQLVRIESEPHSDLGVSLCFMALSVSYTANTKTLFKHHPDEDRQRFNFNFTCSRFSANVHYSSVSGGTEITRFPGIEEVKKHPYKFDDVTTRSFYADAYYFFNHRRYSQAAAYCFSKYQLRSAGSWLAGFLFTRQNIVIDFSHLPEDMLEHLPSSEHLYHFHYKAYSLAGGYGYNWVLKPRTWLINITALPAIGYRHSYEDSSIEGTKRSMISANFRGMMSVVYNYKRLFASLVGNVNSHIYFTKPYTFVNTQLTGSVTVGVRF